MQRLMRQFVPCSDAVWGLQHGSARDSRYFQRFAAEVDVNPGDGSDQGIYLVAPSGKLLAACNETRVAPVVACIRRGLKAWARMPAAQRYLRKPPESVRAIKRREARYPSDGLVLRTAIRDLPRRGVSKALARSWNRDFVWFTRAEMRKLAPSHPRRGMRYKLPKVLAYRLALFHLVDYIRGPTENFEPRHVAYAELSGTVTGLTRGIATIAFSGRTRTVDGTRGMQTRILGSARWNVRRQRFERFELLALGSRWGATAHSRRQGDAGPAPFGCLMQLAGKGADERIPPHFYGGYYEFSVR